MRKYWIVLIIVTVSLTGCREYGEKMQCLSEEEIYTPVLVDLFDPAPPFLGTDQKYHLLYGLRLTNAGNQPAQIQKIEVMNTCGDEEVIQSYSEKELISNLKHLNASPTDTTDMDVDVSRIFFIKLAFDQKDSIPRSIQHRITLQGASGPGSKTPSPLSYKTGSFCICDKLVPSLSPPLDGKGWTIFNACCTSKGAHQNSVLPVNGVLYNSQRFAIDFMKLDENNNLYTGDPSTPSNWHCYDQKVFAVNDGEVVSVLEGLEDQPPGSLPDPESLTLKTVTGNHVILKLQPHVYAFYAHLRKDSIQAKVGDKVKKGDEIARVGNSGNTSAPHLHLHLMDTPSPIGSAPIPYTYDQFKITGYIEPDSFYEQEDLKKVDAVQIPEEERKNQYPLDLNILEFK